MDNKLHVLIVTYKKPSDKHPNEQDIFFNGYMVASVTTPECIYDAHIGLALIDGEVIKILIQKVADGGYSGAVFEDIQLDGHDRFDISVSDQIMLDEKLRKLKTKIKCVDTRHYSCYTVKES